jgi:ABC-type uncharacterized transport system permease subunit
MPVIAKLCYSLFTTAAFGALMLILIDTQLKGWASIAADEVPDLTMYGFMLGFALCSIYATYLFIGMNMRIWRR